MLKRFSGPWIIYFNGKPLESSKHYGSIRGHVGGQGAFNAMGVIADHEAKNKRQCVLEIKHEQDFDKYNDPKLGL